MIALGVATVWLNGCVGTASSHTCPPVIAYPPATQERAAGDIFLLPPDSPVVVMLEDYAVLRDQLRACR